MASSSSTCEPPANPAAAAPDELIVVETSEAFRVAYAAEPGDWVASFRKRAGFPARQWAERMVSLSKKTSG